MLYSQVIVYFSNASSGHNEMRSACFSKEIMKRCMLTLVCALYMFTFKEKMPLLLSELHVPIVFQSHDSYVMQIGAATNNADHFT